MGKWSVDASVGAAWTIPSAFYTDPAVFEEAKEAIFAKSWQFISEVESVKVPTSVYPFTLLEGLLDEPLLFTRDRDDQIHCLSNVCTHRGNIVCEGAGCTNSLRCRYHGRKFDLNGRMTYMPEFEGVEGFPCEADNLPKVNFGQWRKWLFASLDPAVSLEALLKPIDDRIGHLPMEEFVYAPERARDYLVKAHWALYVDNYLEGFHIPYIHPALNQTLNYGDYRTEFFDGGNVQIGVGSGADECFVLPETSPDFGENIAAYYYWIYPNLMLNFYPWGLSVNVVKPLGVDRTRVSFIPFVYDESKISSGAGSILDRVEREDEQIVELVQKGLRSRFYDRGRYSPLRENGVHQFHQLIAASLENQ